MDQRRAGISVLLGALLIIALAAIGRPADVFGAASRTPLPVPPQVGDCIEGGRLWVSVPVVPCTVPHTLEVTARWLAEDPARTDAYIYETCQQKAWEYVAVDQWADPQGWLTPVNTQVFTVEAPAEDRFGDQGWVVCAVAPAIDTGQFVGSLRGPFDERQGRPAALAKCRGEIGIGYEADVACEHEHGSEIIAEKQVSVTTNFTDADITVFQGEIGAPSIVLDGLTDECVAIAATLMDTDDPTYGGELVLSAEQMWFFVSAGEGFQSDLYVGCTVRAADKRGLVGTLLGWAIGRFPTRVERGGRGCRADRAAVSCDQVILNGAGTSGTSARGSVQQPGHVTT